MLDTAERKLAAGDPLIASARKRLRAGEQVAGELSAQAAEQLDHLGARGARVQQPPGAGSFCHIEDDTHLLYRAVRKDPSSRVALARQRGVWSLQLLGVVGGPGDMRS